MKIKFDLIISNTYAMEMSPLEKKKVHYYVERSVF